ncbi:MAG: hypothetical protein NXI04_05095 [Planctomycetaceae bacterium]|nr:hypothetical protein [Planctomycetaceae bacterium]
MWKSVRHRVCCLLILAVCFAAGPRSCAQSALPDRDEEEFLRQLIGRQFYDLARQYCEQQNRRATTTDESAKWQRRIGQIYAEQAWLSDADSRDGLLALAVERTTDFLKDQAPSAEEQFLLRIQQAGLLSQSVRMGLVVDEGGHLFARETRDSVPLAHSGADDDNGPVALSPQQKAWRQSLTRSEELLAALERQLATLKRELNSRQVLEIRDQLKLQLLETRLLQWRLLSQTDPRQAFRMQNELDEQLDALARSTRSPVTESLARLKLAEISLHSHDTQRFDLRVRSPRREYLQDQWVVPAFFEARSLLSRQDPTAVGRVLQNVSLAKGVQRQHLIWLQLEQRLGDCELAAELENPELVTRSRIAFERQLQQAGRQLQGVFRDAAERTSRRYRLVREVGVHIADLVETVEVEKQRGNFQSALRLIDRSVAKLPPTRDGPRAALLLRAGELHIAAGQWPQAVSRLQQAERLFAKAGRASEQATADLLRIFALSRISQQTPDRTDYLEALEAHVRQFSQEPTADQARRWLLLAVRNSNKPRAAVLAADIAKATSSPRQKLAAWNDFVVCFDQALQSQQQTGADFEGREQLEADLRTQISQMQQQPDLFAENEMVSLLSLQLMLDFQRDVNQGNSLEDYAERSKKIRSLTASPTPLNDQEQQQVLRRMDLLDVIIAARSRVSPEQMDLARRRLMQSDAAPMMTVSQLSVHISVQQPQSGDGWLAGMGADLLHRELTEQTKTQSKAATAALIRHLPLAQKFSQLGHRSELMSRWVDRLLSGRLSAEQTFQVASVLGASPTSGNGQTVAAFWKQVLTTQAKGSDLWLTAQLKLADADVQNGNFAEAARRLGVVSTLYPDWGSPERKTEAARLRMSLPRQ